MTVHKVYRIACNTSGCRHTLESIGASSVSEMRAYARERGWQTGIIERRVHGGPSRSLDACPAHAAVAPEAA